jgi:uncharacterized membrane protein
MRKLLAVMMAAAGTNHFVNTGFYLKLMPAVFPHPHALVLISGLAAIVLGALLFFKKTAPLGAWGTILFLVAVFPANLRMALHPEIFPRFPAWTYWARLPLQGVFAAWAYRYAKPV